MQTLTDKLIEERRSLKAAKEEVKKDPGKKVTNKKSTAKKAEPKKEGE